MPTEYARSKRFSSDFAFACVKPKANWNDAIQISFDPVKIGEPLKTIGYPSNYDGGYTMHEATGKREQVRIEQKLIRD